MGCTKWRGNSKTENLYKKQKGMAFYDDVNPVIAIQLELVALGLVALATGIWWQVCLFAKFESPWITPMILLTGLNIYMIQLQYPQGFSLRGLGLRIAADIVTFIMAFIVLWLLYAMGVPIPDTADSPVMVVYSFPYVLGFTALYRFIIMSVWCLLAVVGVA
ncbi:unnamed protein product [Allacma fusca]|uniref:Uncharacterized protein n=1 Tax=Allacma fusca TaxID=39272 RepID=A0A8J2IZS8_9HEXA|nr:unnamed protein product [Allacma fusca]